MNTEPRTKYIVFKANIMDDDGNKVLAGEIVALSPKLARHYSKLGFLKPYFDETVMEDDDESEEVATADDNTSPIIARTRRVAAVTENTRLSPGAAEKPL